MTERRPAEEYIRVCRQHSLPDWEHTPNPFKLSQKRASLPMSAPTLTALALDQDVESRCSLGLLLHEIYGVVRMIAIGEWDQITPDEKEGGEDAFRTIHPYPLSLHRPVASGGACFPGELYLLVAPEQEIAAGVYHYDPAHHALDLLSAGDFTLMLLDVLAQPPETLPGYALLFSSFFWKDGFKYQEFSYRLQSLDVGCLLAQAQAVAEHYHLQPKLHFQFLDARLNHLLGLKGLEESIYAVVTLETSVLPMASGLALLQEGEALTDEEHPRLPSTFEYYESLTRWPLLANVHRASCIETQAGLCEKEVLPPLAEPPPMSDLVIKLPAATYTYCRDHTNYRRSAHPLQFRPHPLTLQQLALLLQAGQHGYQSDLNGKISRLGHTLLYCIINHVEEVPPGIYLYQAESHQLRHVCSEEFHQAFSSCQSDPRLNIHNLSLCVIPVGNYARGFPLYGDRWYRLHNMEAGMITQRLYLAAAANGLGCRASLHYQEQSLDMLLRLPKDYTSLIQVLISPVTSGRGDRGCYEQLMRW